MSAVRALFFDIFGTVVDWRGGIARETRKLLKPLGYTLDWIEFAEAWRAGYQPAMGEVRAGNIPFSKLDDLHRSNLDQIRPRFGLQNLDENTLRKLNTAWHRLDAWPDAAKGLKRLRKHFLLAPVSNGNIALMVRLARHNRFRWDAILGAEIAGDYKPKPVVYQAACAAFGLPPQACMMVAAHSYDLEAAAACGLRTGHVARPDEAGRGTGEARPGIEVDVAAKDFLDLARKLDA